jgi:hypothetical protein
MMPCPMSGCWIWTAGYDGKGYGKYYLGGGRKDRRESGAHRVAYKALVGPVPDELDIDHRVCRTPACCNPAHLEPVTRRINLLRGDTITARNAAVTHCSKGHPFDEANTYYRKNGGRFCRACNRANVSAIYHRKRGR